MRSPRTSPDFDVVHVSIVHTWTDTRIFRRECRSLASAGYRVALVAVGDVSERVDGVTVIGFPTYSGRAQRIRRGLPRMLRVLREVSGRVYHLHDPELLALAPVLRLRGARVVYDAHEDLPRQMLGKGFPEPIGWAFSLVAHGLCAFAGVITDRVVAATATVARRFPASKVDVVRNLPELLPDIDDRHDYEDRADVAVYVGSISESRGVREIVEAADRGLPEHWSLQLIGPSQPPDLLDEILADHDPSRVHWEGRLAPVEARKKAAAARFGLVVLRPTRAYFDALPTKLFEYMAAGLPVIASDFPLWRQVVEGHDCGLLVDPTDVGQIARAMARLADNPAEARAMGARGRDAVREQLNWEQEQLVLLDLYARLAPSVSESPGAR